ncbi:Oxygen-independent coproporphyrinogen-III oxidase [compost metagenome]
MRGLHCNADDLLRRDIIQRLICHFELEFASLEQAHDIRMPEYFGDIWPRLQAMHQDGLLALEPQGIQILPAGRLLVRSVCMLFDRYLEPTLACGH